MIGFVFLVSRFSFLVRFSFYITTRNKRETRNMKPETVLIARNRTRKRLVGVEEAPGVAGEVAFPYVGPGDIAGEGATALKEGFEGALGGHDDDILRKHGYYRLANVDFLFLDAAVNILIIGNQFIFRMALPVVDMHKLGLVAVVLKQPKRIGPLGGHENLVRQRHDFSFDLAPLLRIGLTNAQLTG